MHWKIVAISTVVVAALFVTVARPGSNASEQPNMDRVQMADQSRPQAFATNPIVPSETAPSMSSGDAWGPVRLTDW